MVEKFLSALFMATLILTSCQNPPKQVNPETKNNSTVVPPNDEIVNSTSTDKDGNKLEIAFNNTNDIATVKFKGETIELVGQKPASGILYKNENYELRGKGEDIEFSKNGKIIFTNEVKDKDNSENIKQTDKTKTDKYWWENKNFGNNRAVSKNPEEGGADFLKFNGNKADYKVGDIVNQMSWAVNGNKLILTDLMHNRKILFKVIDSYLLDEYGTKWTIKK